MSNASWRLTLRSSGSYLLVRSKIGVIQHLPGLHRLRQAQLLLVAALGGLAQRGVLLQNGRAASDAKADDVFQRHHVCRGLIKLLVVEHMPAEEGPLRRLRRWEAAHHVVARRIRRHALAHHLAGLRIPITPR